MTAAPIAPIKDKTISHRSTGSTPNAIGDTTAALAAKKMVSAPRRICPCRIPTNAINVARPDTNIIGVKAAALGANEIIDRARAMFNAIVINLLPGSYGESDDLADGCFGSVASS